MSTQSSPDTKMGRAGDDLTLDIDAETRRRYAEVKAGLPDEMSITLLHVGAEQTSIAVGNRRDADATLALSIGSKKTAREHFRHVPPTPGELEDAIATIEDTLAPARAEIPNASALFTTDVAIREIASIAGIAGAPNATLALAAVEQTFQRLAAVALGGLAAGRGIPASAEFAETLLILREFMHHMRFPSITVMG